MGAAPKLVAKSDAIALWCPNALSATGRAMVTEGSSTVPQHSGGRDPEGEARRSTATPTPMLASEILREVVAPLTPWTMGVRLWDALIAVVLAALGVGMHLGFLAPTKGGPWFEYVLAAVVLVIGLVPGSYAGRGVASLVVGLVLAGLGLFGAGPLGGCVPSDASPAIFILILPSMMVLPAALLLRDRYPAYNGARVALLVAFAATLPTIIVEGMLVFEGPLIASVVVGVNLAVIVLSLVGFMGVGTTGVSKILAFGVLVTFGAERMLRFLWSDGSAGWLADLRDGLVLLVAGGLAAKGLFVIMASTFAADARRVDVLGMRTRSIGPPRD